MSVTIYTTIALLVGSPCSLPLVAGMLVFPTPTLALLVGSPALLPLVAGMLVFLSPTLSSSYIVEYMSVIVEILYPSFLSLYFLPFLSLKYASLFDAEFIPLH